MIKAGPEFLAILKTARKAAIQKEYALTVNAFAKRTLQAIPAID